MGIINHDVVTLDNRIGVTNTYYSLHCCSVGLTKTNHGDTRFQADFGIWKDKDTRDLTIQDEKVQAPTLPFLKYPGTVL